MKFLSLGRTRSRRAHTSHEPVESCANEHRVVRHDIATALLAIEGAVASLRSIMVDEQTAAVPVDEQTPQAEAILSAIELEVGRVRRISSTGAPDSSPRCEVTSTIRPLVDLCQAAGFDVVAILEPNHLVAMSADDLAQCVSNMLDNCARHAPESSIEITGLVSNGRYQLSVGDHGPGLSKSVRAAAFDFGVSTRESGGIGLYSVRQMTEACGGSVRIETSRSGTTIDLMLPLVQAATTQPARPEGAARAISSHR